jgi:hypothetical protein
MLDVTLIFPTFIIMHILSLYIYIYMGFIQKKSIRELSNQLKRSKDELDKWCKEAAEEDKGTGSLGKPPQSVLDIRAFIARCGKQMDEVTSLSLSHFTCYMAQTFAQFLVFVAFLTLV